MKKGKKAAGIALLAAVTLLGILIFTGQYRCPVYQTLGVPCPGCGMSRAAMSLMRGDFAGAFAWHPGIYVLIFLALLFAAGLLSAKNRTGQMLIKRGKRYLLAACGALVLIFLLRMIFLFPDSAPMTFNESSLLHRLSCFLRG